MTPSRSVLFAPFAAIAVLAVAILILTGGSARAATPTYADPAGTCAGLTPCFTTVQDAVFDAGPAPAVVNIFPGTYAESVNLDDMGDGSPGDITLQAVDAAGAATVGTVTIAPVTGHAVYSNLAPFPGSITINGVIATSPDSDAFEFWASGNISLSDTTTNDTDADGVDVVSDADITITNATANNNFDGGFNLETSGGNITITGSTANGNTDAEGFDLETDGDISITGTEASGNYDEGIEIDGYEAESGNVTITDVVTNDSESDDGIDVDATNVTITNTTANGNEDEGLETNASETTLIDRATTIGNFSDGIDVEGTPSKGYFTNSVTIVNSYTGDNEDVGIEFLEPDTFVDGTLMTNSNVICDNVVGGYQSLDDGASNAEGNWWGAATGPTHPSNAGGTGDGVLDAANPGPGSDGTVDFDPFISTSSGSGSATVGLASTISFQFTGTGGTPALQEGPGDETGTSPFTVTTDNGTATVGFITGGKLDVSLTAATVGTANVSVTGPCGLVSATLPFAVAVADVVGTPIATPVQLPDTGGSAQSNGSLPLTTVVALTTLAMILLSAAGFAWSRAR